MVDLSKIKAGDPVRLADVVVCEVEELCTNNGYRIWVKDADDRMWFVPASLIVEHVPKPREILYTPCSVSTVTWLG